jgi:predicted ArsR family transcriptional regulator
MAITEMTERVKTHSVLASASRMRLLDTLRANQTAMDARELAEACELHVTTTRFHLDELRDAGLVAVHPEERAVRGRPRMLYSARSFGDSPSAGAHGYQQLAEILATHWSDGAKEQSSAHAERAGRDWARQEVRGIAPTPTASPTVLEVTAQVNALFAELGFDPELQHDNEDVHILMRSCPFAVVAAAYPEVVCSLHLGLLDGALTELGAPPVVTRLQVRREPQLCVAHISPSTDHEFMEIADV